MEENNLNWESDFSVNITFGDDKNAKELNAIPNNIYSIEFPKINPIGIEDKEYLILTLRSIEGNLVENEVIDILFKYQFDINVSLKNSNKILWQFKNCTVNKLGFSTLKKTKAKANPFNIILYILAESANYKGLSTTIEFRKQSFSEMVTEWNKENKIQDK